MDGNRTRTCLGHVAQPLCGVNIFDGRPHYLTKDLGIFETSVREHETFSFDYWISHVSEHGRMRRRNARISVLSHAKGKAEIAHIGRQKPPASNAM